MVWKKILVKEFHNRLFSARQSLICNAIGMILAISESPCCWKPSIKFLLKRIYGLKEDVE